jgi:hypothetical protein
MALTLPFAHLNLRHNPFGEATREERASLAVVELPELRPGDPVQFVGACGRGKTTHLLAIAALRPEAEYVRLDEGEDRVRSRSPVLLIDEAQRLRDVKGVLGRALALGSHADLSSRAGRPLRTVLLEGLGLGRLESVVSRRIEWARRGPGPVPRVARTTLAKLLARHGDDLRAMEGDLYDAIQRLEGPGDVEV